MGNPFKTILTANVLILAYVGKFITCTVEPFQCVPPNKPTSMCQDHKIVKSNHVYLLTNVQAYNACDYIRYIYECERVGQRSLMAYRAGPPVITMEAAICIVVVSVLILTCGGKCNTLKRCSLI